MFSVLRQKPGFYGRLWKLSLPIILQNLITTSLGFVDTFMVGLLGNDPLSAVTAANTPIFMVQVVIFGVMSGLTVLVSQYWGKGDTVSINRVMGVAAYAGFAVSGLAALVLFLFPEWVMGLVTNNAGLIVLGAPYVRIVGVSYVFNAISSVYVGMQRSTENPGFGMVVFAISMLLNTFLNYCLIFGNFGAPRLEIAGAALATLTARVVEFAIVFVYAVTNRRIPLAPKALLRPGKTIAKSAVVYAGPIIVNETLWGLGTAVMTAIMGHMAISADMLAAHAIMGNIDKFATVACFGLAGSTAVIVGKRIGERASEEEVYNLSYCLLLVSFLLGAAVALVLAVLLPTLFIPILYPLFSLTETAVQVAVTMCTVYIVMMPMKSFDVSNITGVLRAGGDARAAAILDLIPLWMVAVPLTALTGLVLHAPIWLVCLSIYSENICKMPAGFLRFKSRKWINDVTIREGAGEE